MRSFKLISVPLFFLLLLFPFAPTKASRSSRTKITAKQFVKSARHRLGRLFQSQKTGELLDAVKLGNVVRVKELLGEGVSPNGLYAFKSTPLHVALLEGHLEIAHLLLKHGADVNAEGFFGETPLHIASAKGRSSMIKPLIDKGANLEAKDENERTPLHMSSFKSHAETTKELLYRGADVNSKDVDGKIPLELAENKNVRELFKLYGGKGNP